MASASYPVGDPEPYVDRAADLVTSGWASAQSYASQAVASANTFLASIASVADSIKDIPKVLEELELPEAPVLSDFDGYLTSAQSAFDQFTGPTNSDFTGFNLNSLQSRLAALQLNFSDLNSHLNSWPDSPTLASPAIDTAFGDLSINIDRFDSMLAAAPVAPGNNFAFSETIYSSNLLVDLRAQLLAWVDGVSTGLTPAVEQAIWDRGRNREAVNAAKKSTEAIRTFATRGFTKPPGALSAEIMEAMQVAQDANSTLSRDIAIKQAELEQSNRRFSMEQAWKVEEGAISYTNQRMQRALDAAKALQGFYFDLYQHSVAAFGTQMQAYAARVGAETSVYKTKVDARAAQINAQVEVYKADTQAIIGLFQQKIANFSARVQAYAAGSGAKIAEYEAKTKEITAEGEQKIAAFETPIKLAAEVLAQKVAKFNADVNGFSARVTGSTSLYRAGVDGLVSEAGLRIEASKANITMAIQEVQMLLEAVKAGAQVSAQLAASAMSAVNLSGGLHSSSSTSQGVSFNSSSAATSSVSDSTSTSTNTNYNYTP